MTPLVAVVTFMVYPSELDAPSVDELSVAVEAIADGFGTWNLFPIYDMVALWNLPLRRPKNSK